MQELGELRFLLQVIGITWLVLCCAIASAQAESATPRSADVPLTAEQERALRPKDAFRECENCPEMVVVPAGTFTMGSDPDEKDRQDWEGPQHTVTFGKQFAVGKFHVTRDEFATFVSETAYQASSTCWTSEDRKIAKRADRSWQNPSIAQDGTHPVLCVTWNDANAYVSWVTNKTRKPYRLLSEAEFEYAARAQTTPGKYPRFWFGDDENDICDYANLARSLVNLSTAQCIDGFEYTSPAGHYSANAFGLFDMAGNAWQWMADCWQHKYEGAPSDGSAWATTCSSNRHVIRGGTWSSRPAGLRAGYRFHSGDASFLIGFRLARTLISDAPSQ